MGKHIVSGSLVDYYVTDSAGVRERRMAFRGDEIELDSAEARRLNGLGVLSKESIAVPGPVHYPALPGDGTPSTEPVVTTDPADPAVDRPANTDSVAVWREYAVKRGVTPEEAAKLDRKVIIERFPATPPAE
ncbi:hypothetical protein DMP17_22160 [Pseudonocardia sp. TMWB2A]|uniref:hypothetical protein n=1 Tax=Pseudonocardia sp. TMWB2A TaxID=687430 RepID=UPI00307CE981